MTAGGSVAVGQAVFCAAAASIAALAVSSCSLGGALKRQSCSPVRAPTSSWSASFTNSSSTAGGALINAAWNSSTQAVEMTRPTRKPFPDGNSTSDWFDMSSTILLLHLDEAAGATTFSNTSGTTLSTINCVSCPTAGQTGGPLTKNLTFNGTSQYVVVADVAALRPSGSLSISAWIRPERRARADYTELMTILEKGTNNTSDSYNFSIQTGGLRFEFNDSGGTLRGYTETVPSILYGSWQHVGVVFDATNAEVRFYKNGQLTTATATAFSLNNTYTNDLHLGRQQSGTTAYFKGDMDEVAIWGRALSTAEMASIYSNQSQASTTTGSFLPAASDVNCAAWTQASWVPEFPQGKLIPANGGTSPSDETSSQYGSGGVSTANQIVLLRFDESSIKNGTSIRDSSGNGWHGTFVSDDSAEHKVTGQFNNGVYFNGGDYVQVPNPGGTYLNITFSMWIKKTNPTGSNSNSIMNWGFPVTSPHEVNFLMTENNFGFPNRIAVYGSDNIQSNIDAQIQSNSQYSLSDGNWHHWAWRKTTTGSTWFLDGRQIITYTDLTGNFIPYIDIYLGGRWTGAAFDSTRWYSGFMDEFAIWGRALTDAEIFDLYRRGIAQMTVDYRVCGDSTCTFGSPEFTGSVSELTNTAGTLPSFNQSVSIPLQGYFQPRFSFSSRDFLITPSVKSARFQ